MRDRTTPSASELARERAQKLFAARDERDNQIKQTIANDRAKQEANTVKLRALRLAKEQADRAAAVDTGVEIRRSPVRKSVVKPKRA